MLIEKRSSLRILTTLLIVSTLILSVPVLITPIHETHAATTRTISLVGTFNAWNASTNPNPSITVTQGDTLTIKLTSTDTTHLFFVDVDRNGITPDCPPGPDPCSNAFTPTTPTTFTFQVSFAAGTYTYYCSVHPTTMLGSFIVQSAPDYMVSANPSSLSIGQGLSGTSAITVTSLGGFSGTVGLTAKVSPTGPMAQLSPTSVTLTSGGSQTSQLTVSTSPTTPTGMYSVTVNATSGSLVHTVTIPVTVTNGGSVGGTFAPIDKLAIIAPYAVAAVLLLAGIAAVLALTRRSRQRQ